MSKQAVHAVETSNLWEQFFGFGAGVGGYQSSSFPTPHNMILNVIVDTGYIGLGSYLFFIALLCLALLRPVLKGGERSLVGWLVFLAAGSTLATYITYVPQFWGFYMILLLIGCAAVSNIGAKADFRME
jgi:hypothetical protein